MADDGNGKGWKAYIEGAVGAGLVLVVLPGAALFFGMDRIGRSAGAGLPILAVFGITILFGSLALISTLFARLKLATADEALALPRGSIRAAIALSLVVLFAIISIMLYQTLAEPYRITGLSREDKEKIIAEPTNRVLAVYRAACAPAPAASGAEATARECYEVHIVRPPGQESTDLAKQLLILIGTLMTSVTSYYFAARNNTAPPTPKAPDEPAPQEDKDKDGRGAAPTAAAAAPSDEEHHDGCELPITDGTPDEELPPAKGGVA